MTNKKKKVKKQKTIKFSELKVLCFCNSKRLPSRILVGGKPREWTGFSWIELDDDDIDGTEVEVVEG